MDPETGKGEKNYIIREQIPSDVKKGMIYDAHEEKVKVTLTLEDDGTITAVADKNPDRIVFRNSYEKEQGPTYDHKFTFTKLWQGDTEKSIEFTLYSSDGTVRHKKFNKKVISETEWRYEAWFETETDYYVIEEVPEGYKVRYENVGVHEGVTDRCYSGGTIINYKLPKTGDSENPVLWLTLVTVGCLGLFFLYSAGKRSKKQN